MTVPGLRHVLDNGTVIFPPFPASDLQPSLHQQGLGRVQPESSQTKYLELELGKLARPDMMELQLGQLYTEFSVNTVSGPDRTYQLLTFVVIFFSQL